MGTQIIQESKRCLQCANPQCVRGCPVDTPIPEMIRMLLEGNIRRAGEMLFRNNPLSVVCSLVCPHESFCEGHCILGHKNKPVRISSMEHYISDYYLRFMDTLPEEKIPKKVGVIGAGPAGITVAFLLALRGYDITIYESKDKIGGVLRYGIPDFRLPKTLLDRLEEHLIRMGVTIRPNTLIGKRLTLEDLFRDGFEALFIGTGVWNPHRLDIKGESLGHVHYALDYLRNPEVYRLGERVCVIGAGNTAMDVARSCLRRGAREVTVLYRKDKQYIPARDVEVEYALIDGVQFLYRARPLEITSQGVQYAKTLEEESAPGRYNDTGETALLSCDTVIIAISQDPCATIPDNSNGLETGIKGLLITDSRGHTSREGIFASGDVVTGAKTVVEAVAQSKIVVQAMEEYLERKNPDSP